MMSNQSVPSLNRYGIKFLVAEKSKPHEISRRMYDVNGEAGFSFKKYL